MNTALAALVRNDLRLFFSDRRAMVITILVPVAIASFFGMILGGGGSKPQSAIALLVADEDHSPVSEEIIRNLKEDTSLSVQTVTSTAARQAVNEGKSPVALILPPDFGKISAQALFAGPRAKRPDVVLRYDPSHGAEFQMVRGLVMQQVFQVVSRRAFSAQSAPASMDEQLRALQANSTMPSGDKAALSDLLSSVKRYYGRSGTVGAETGNATDGPNLAMPVNFVDEAATTGEKDAVRVGTVTHSFLGMAVQGVLFFAVDAAMGMLRDRRNGLWKRLRAAPLSRAMLLGGKLCSTALIAFVIIGIVFAAGTILFGIRIHGSVPGFVLVSACTAFMVAGFGLLIAALGRTEQQSRGYAMPVVLGLNLFGGSWFPSFMMPSWVQSISLALPSRWALDGFDAMTWRGFAFSSALLPSLILLGFAAVFGVFAFLRFRWETE